MSKGSARRPAAVDRETEAANWARTFGQTGPRPEWPHWTPEEWLNSPIWKCRIRDEVEAGRDATEGSLL